MAHNENAGSLVGAYMSELGDWQLEELEDSRYLYPEWDDAPVEAQ